MFAIGDSIGAGYHKGKIGIGMQGSGWGFFDEEGLDVRWGGVMEGTIHDEDFKQYALPDWEPMEFNQDGFDMLMLPSAGDEVGLSILDTLKFL